MKITCDVIRDLIPSYVDQICSEDSKNIVEEHLKICEPCRMQAEAMKTPVTCHEIYQQDKEKAREPFKKIKRKNHLHILAAVILTGILSTCCYMVIQNVSVLHDFFFPQIRTDRITSDSNDSWEALHFDESDYLNFDSIFYDQEVTNDANSSGDVTIRILDMDGNIIVEEATLRPGNSFGLKKLKRNTDYIVEIQTSAKDCFLNFY